MTDVPIDVRSLAALARIEVPEAELAKLEEELPNILGFVETIQRANVAEITQAPALRNVMRDDANPHESGIYTEKLLEQAPAREGNRLAVKQVLSRKK